MNLFNSYVEQVHKSFSEALILASINPKYDKRLFIELRVQYKKSTSSEHVVHTNWFLFWHSEQFIYTTCSELVVFVYWTGKSMNNLLTYCGLIDTRIRASDKDLPVCQNWCQMSVRPFLVFLDTTNLPYCANNYLSCP